MTRAEAGLLAAIALLGGFVAVQGVRARAPRAVGEAGRATDSSVIVAGRGDVRVETRQSMLGAPASDPGEVRRRILLGGGTYLGDMLREADSTLARWPDRQQSPIRVWVQPASTAAGWRPEFGRWVRDAFGRWELIGLPVRFVFVPDSAASDVRVGFVDRLTAETRIGSTRRVHDQNWWVVEGSITLATHTVDGRALDSTLVRTAALHEVGHLLGLGHTSDTTALMAPRTYGVADLTPRDLATVRLLYDLPPGRVR